MPSATAAAPRSAAPLAEARHLLSMGQIASAKALLLKALDRAATRPEARYLLAVADVMQGNAAAAIEHAIVAVTANPSDARYRFTLGRACKAVGDLEGAESAYRRALELDPSYADAMVSLGIVLRAKGQVEDAIAIYERALAINPAMPAALANLANALAQRNERAVALALVSSSSDEVIEAHARAVASDPHNALLHRNHGVALILAQRRLDAVHAFNQALSIDPTDVDSCLKLGSCLRALGSSKLARMAYEKWLDLNPPSAPVMRALGDVLTRDGQVDEGLKWVEKAVAIDTEPRAQLQLGNALMQSRRMAEALQVCRQCVDVAGQAADTYPMLLLGMNYLVEDAKAIADAHAEFGRALSPAMKPARRQRAPGERLRVGYVSGDFVRHSVAYFVSPLLEWHDKERFEIVCYHNLAWGDHVTERLKSYGHRWVECEGIANEALRQRIIADGIDILIDLAGHTTHSRSFMFALGAAPVQMAYLGYPTVSGVPAIDFRITDAVIDPGDMPSAGGEVPLCLPRSMFCYRADEAPIVREPPCRSRGYLTFGSFNNIAKVTDHTLELWAKVMSAVPHSRLMLKAAAMAQTVNRINVEQFMAARGIAPARLELQPFRGNVADHLDLYNEIDIALDTYPYNGATTTCEALWMGVPVVSRSGATHTSRMGASLLCAIGKPEWIGHDDQAFVQIASRLAEEPTALAAWRSQARCQIAGSALMDELGFTRAFETLLSNAWLQ